MTPSPLFSIPSFSVIQMSDTSGSLNCLFFISLLLSWEVSSVFFWPLYWFFFFIIQSCSRFNFQELFFIPFPLCYECIMLSGRILVRDFVAVLPSPSSLCFFSFLFALFVLDTSISQALHSCLIILSKEYSYLLWLFLSAMIKHDLKSWLETLSV